MSQHILSTTTSRGRKVSVTLGYDRPLDYVFCTVMDADGDVIYSNLGDKMAGTDLQDVDYFRLVLRQLGIDAPDAMFTEVKSDQALRVGNRVEHYTAKPARARVDSPIERLTTVVRRAMMKIRLRAEPDQNATIGPEALDLLELIGENAANEPDYCSSSYWKWEVKTATPLLEKLGYANIRFSMGECDSFSPLTRVVTAEKNGVRYRFIYG
jgi:hypothetical protein